MRFGILDYSTRLLNKPNGKKYRPDEVMSEKIDFEMRVEVHYFDIFYAMFSMWLPHDRRLSRNALSKTYPRP